MNGMLSTMTATARTCSAPSGRSSGTLVEDRRDGRAAILLCVAYLTLLGTQDDRLDARSASARTASARSACCSRSPTRSS